MSRTAGKNLTKGIMTVERCFAPFASILEAEGWDCGRQLCFGPLFWAYCFGGLYTNFCWTPRVNMRYRNEVMIAYP